MKGNAQKTIKIILAILIILLPYIHSGGDIKGEFFFSPMYEIFYISKILSAIVGIYLISKEI